MYIYNKENQKGVSETNSKTLKKYSRPSSRRHLEYRVPMTFLVSVSIKIKVPDMFSTSLKRKGKEEKKNLAVNPNNIQKQFTKNMHMKIANLKKKYYVRQY